MKRVWGWMRRLMIWALFLLATMAVSGMAFLGVISLFSRMGWNTTDFGFFWSLFLGVVLGAVLMRIIFARTESYLRTIATTKTAEDAPPTFLGGILADLGWWFSDTQKDIEKEESVGSCCAMVLVVPISVGLIIFVPPGLDSIGAGWAISWFGLGAGIVGMICLGVACVHSLLTSMRNNNKEDTHNTDGGISS